jgi:hypothetical protein
LFCDVEKHIYVHGERSEHMTTASGSAASKVNNPQFADVVFKLGTECIYGHRVYLSNSEYFATMLSSGLQEGKEGKKNADGLLEIVMSETNVEAFVCLLEYVYTGVATRITADTLVDVAALGHQYMEKGLLAECWRLMGVPEMITTTNWIGLYSLLTCDEVKKECMTPLLTYVSTHGVEIVQALQNDPSMLDAFNAIQALRYEIIERISSSLPRKDVDSLVTFWVMHVLAPRLLASRQPKKHDDPFCALIDVYRDVCYDKCTTDFQLQVTLSYTDVHEVIVEAEHKGDTKLQTFVQFIDKEKYMSITTHVNVDGHACLNLYGEDKEGFYPWIVGLDTKRMLLVSRNDRAAISDLGPVIDVSKQIGVCQRLSLKRYRSAELCLDVIARNFNRIPLQALQQLDALDLETLLAHDDLAVEDETTLLHTCEQLFHPIHSRNKESKWSFVRMLNRLRVNYIAPETLVDILARGSELNISREQSAWILSRMLNPDVVWTATAKPARKGYAKSAPCYGKEALFEFITAHRVTKKRQRDEDHCGGDKQRPSKRQRAEF